MIRKKQTTKYNDWQKRGGIVLLITLIVLVVLSSAGYTLSTRLLAQRRRNQFIVDYTHARYGCDSAVKYALATVSDMNEPALISRPNEPDFSDLFALTDEEYNKLLALVDEANTVDAKISSNASGGGDDEDMEDLKKLFAGINDINSTDDINDFNEPVDANVVKIRGPYGFQWPLVTEPVEFEVGPASIRIEIEDENAKYPLYWSVLEDEDISREVEVGFESFCEWMDVNSPEIKELKEQLHKVSELKKFEMEMKSVKVVEEQQVEVSSKRRRKKTFRTRKVVRDIPAAVHLSDFSKIFHSSLFSTQVLARPSDISETRKESALKYMGTWGSKQVNINTAPRHVLEAAFVFGGDAEAIANEIIYRRRIKPFDSIDELKELLLRYSSSIEKCEQFITVKSDFFTIRITATSGTAKLSAVIAVIKDEKNITQVAVLSE